MQGRSKWVTLATGGFALLVGLAVLSTVIAQPRARRGAGPNAAGFRAGPTGFAGQALPQLGIHVDPEIKKLRGDIEVLSLVRRIDLTRDQITSIVKLLSNYDQAQKRFEEDLNKSLDANRDLLTQVRASLIRGEEPSPELQRHVRETMVQSAPQIRDFMEVRRRAAEAIAEVLTEQQLERLNRPGGAAGAQPEERLGQLLNRVRQIPDADYEARRNELSQRMSQGLPDEAQRAERAQQLTQLFDQARNVAADQWPAQKPRFVQRLRELAPGLERRGRALGPAGAGRVGGRWAGGGQQPHGRQPQGQGLRGQGRGEFLGEMMLMRLRQMSEEDYRARRDQIINQILERRAAPGEARPDLAQRLGQLLDQVRGLSDQELQQKMPAIRQQFTELVGPGAAADPRLMIANRFLTGEVKNTISLLKEILAQGR